MNSLRYSEQSLRAVGHHSVETHWYPSVRYWNGLPLRDYYEPIASRWLHPQQIMKCLGAKCVIPKCFPRKFRRKMESVSRTTSTTFRETVYEGSRRAEAGKKQTYHNLGEKATTTTHWRIINPPSGSGSPRLWESQCVCRKRPQNIFLVLPEVQPNTASQAH